MYGPSYLEHRSNRKRIPGQWNVEELFRRAKKADCAMGLIASMGGQLPSVTHFATVIGLELVVPDGHFKIPHLWPGQNPPPRATV